MLNWIVQFSLRFRGVVAVLACVLTGYGIYTAAHAKLDVLPNFVPPQVELAMAPVCGDLVVTTNRFDCGGVARKGLLRKHHLDVVGGKRGGTAFLYAPRRRRALYASLIGIRLASCVAQNGASESSRFAFKRAQRDIPSHRETDDHAFRYLQMIDKREQVIDVGLDRILPVPDVAHPVTADVVRNRPETFRYDRINLALPHLEAEGESVYKYDRRCRGISGEKVVECETIEKCAHGSGGECDEICRGG